MINGEYPTGFGLLLMQNADAMDYFSSLDAAERRTVAKECSAIKTRQEMEAYVNGLAKKRKPEA